MIGKVQLSMIATAAVAALALAACSSSASGTGGGTAGGSSPAAGAHAGDAADSSLPAVTIGYINEDSGPNGQLDSPNGATATVTLACGIIAFPHAGPPVAESLPVPMLAVEPAVAS